MENLSRKDFLIFKTQVDGFSKFANHHFEAFILTNFLPYEFNHHHPYCSGHNCHPFDFCRSWNLQQAGHPQKSI